MHLASVMLNAILDLYEIWSVTNFDQFDQTWIKKKIQNLDEKMTDSNRNKIGFCYEIE